MANYNHKDVWDYNIKTKQLKPINPEFPKVWATDQRGRKVLYQHYGLSSGSGYWDIHHKDGNRNNNALSNLRVLNRESHDSIHNG